jgi:hypothetical protein
MAMLADAAAVADGKLYVHGGGWDVIYTPAVPATHPMLALVFVVEFERSEVPVDRTLRVSLRDEDDTPLDIAAVGTTLPWSNCSPCRFRQSPSPAQLATTSALGSTRRSWRASDSTFVHRQRRAPPTPPSRLTRTELDPRSVDLEALAVPVREHTHIGRVASSNPPNWGHTTPMRAASQLSFGGHHHAQGQLGHDPARRVQVGGRPRLRNKTLDTRQCHDKQISPVGHAPPSLRNLAISG